MTVEEEKIYAEILKIAENFDNRGEKTVIKSPNDDIYGDVGFDSLSSVEFCLLLEHKFKVEFTTDTIANFKTIHDMILEINRLQNKN